MAFWFGVNTYVWHHKRINYSFIFGYNIRTKLSYGELLMVGAYCSLSLSLSLSLSRMSDAKDS